MDYLQLDIAVQQQEHKDILIAALSDIGYEGFREQEHELNAYIETNLFSKEKLHAVFKQFECLFKLSYTKQNIADQNWNEAWEKNYEPIVIDGFCRIRAHFHKPNNECKYEIEITPKMAFGTGHHHSTCIMIDMMRAIDFKEQKVLDFGSGTGILAILASMMGANDIEAIDNNPWAFESTKENISINNISNIKAIEADEGYLNNKHFNIILANINKNIIKDNLSILADMIDKKGLILISGILIENKKEIIETAISCNLIVHKTIDKGKWTGLYFKKS